MTNENYAIWNCDVSHLPESSEWNLLATGDFYTGRALDGNVKDIASAMVSPDVIDVIQSADIAIINFEGPSCHNCPPSPKSGPAIRMEPFALNLIKQLGFSVVTLANNHIMDHGVQGLEETLNCCEELKLGTCGAGMNANAAREPLIRNVSPDVRISIFSLCEREFGIAIEDRPGSAWISSSGVLSSIADAKKNADIVIVFSHGGVEEVPFPPIERQNQLRQLIDAGADLVIGHHPHVPQGWEAYRHGLIFYSLGNFLFDYPGNQRYVKTEWGLMLKLSFRGTTLAGIELIPVEQVDGRVSRMEGKNLSPVACLKYLRRLTDLMADDSTFRPYWQDSAIRLLEDRYGPYLRQGSKSLPSGKGKKSTLEMLNDLTIGRLRNKQLRYEVIKSNQLLLLNMFRNESHRWTIQDALSVLSGNEPDLRTPGVRDEVDQLFKWTQE